MPSIDLGVLMIRHGGLFLIAFVVLSGCGPKKKENGITRWNTFPVPLYADATTLNDPDSKADFFEAMNFWQAKAGRTLFDFKGAWNGALPYSGNPDRPDTIFANVLFFHSAWPYASNIMGKTIVLSSSNVIQSSMIMVNPDANYCTSDCYGLLGSPSSRNVFAHELGHFLGLGHDQNPNNIMYPTLLPGGSLSSIQVDQGTLLQLTM